MLEPDYSLNFSTHLLLGFCKVFVIVPGFILANPLSQNSSANIAASIGFILGECAIIAFGVLIARSQLLQRRRPRSSVKVPITDHKDKLENNDDKGNISIIPRDQQGNNDEQPKE